MNRKLITNFIVLAGVALFGSSCSKSSNGGNTVITPPPANAVPDNYAGGELKGGGTFLTGKTYTISKANVICNGGTVTIQPGAIFKFGGSPQIVTLGYTPKHHDLHINMAQIRANYGKHRNNQLEASAATPAPTYQIYSIYVTGGATLNIQGTKDQHVVFTAMDPNAKWPNGYWGGINCDSSTKAVNIQWADILHTGGSDSIASNQYAFFYGGKANSSASVLIENSTFQYGVDDCTRLEGPIMVSIKGNVFKKEGSNDGDGVNIKSGVTGDVAYNYCWSGANNSIKLNADLKNLAAVTKVNVYNNTIINGGWRKIGEASAGILVDANAKGTVYNNLIVNCRNGLRITAASDTLYNKGKFNNNYIFALVDSSVILAYGPHEWGKKQSNDIVSSKAGDKDPMISAFDPTTLGDASYTDKNDPHLKAGSLAIGAGNSSAPYTQGLGTTNGFLPGKDIGAYQTDGTGNQRIN